MAIRDGRFLHVGDEAGARAALRGRPEELDLGGRCVLPGLTDAHLHFMWYAESLHAVDVETATLEEAAGAGARAAHAEAAPGDVDHRLGLEPQRVGRTARFPTSSPLDAGRAPQPRCAGGKKRARALGELARP